MTPAHARELAELAELAHQEGVRSYLEIGSRAGLSLEVIAGALPDDARIVSVDLPGGPWGSRESEIPLRALIARLRATGRDAHLFEGLSTTPWIVEAVRKLSPFGLLYIDADHRLEGVTADWQIYGPMARIVAFDDVFTPFGVSQLWDEIWHTWEPRCRTIGDPRDRHGIGVLLRRPGDPR